MHRVSGGPLLGGLVLGGVVFKSTDGGGSWTAINNDFPNRVANTLAIDPVNTATLYAGTGSGVFKTTDGGASWTAASNSFRGAVSALAIDPVNPNTVYAGTAAQLQFNLDSQFDSQDGSSQRNSVDAPVRRTG